MVDPSRLVEIHPERVGATSSPHFPHHNSNSIDYSWSLEQFRKSLRIQITRLSPDRIEFDLIGVDASIANALRRTLMAEVPTVAIENVYVWNNTSIVVDEVLSHRLGLVPLKIDPDKFDMKGPEDVPTERNTMVFTMEVNCERIGKPGAGGQITGTKVLSGDLQWDPKGSQEEDWKDNPPRPVHNDILLAKLRPGQKVKLELHCVKGIGRDHAKFSPVCTASYRLLPHIDIPNPYAIEEIPKFVQCFPEGVIGVRKHKDTDSEEVYVKNARKDTVSREVLRHPEFQDKVKLGRIRDHFLFDVESTGAVEPQMLLPSAIQVLLEKIKVLQRGVEQLEHQHSFTAGPAR